MAFQIIKHAFRMIFGNFGQAIRVSFGPFLIAILCCGAVFVFLGDVINAVRHGTDVSTLDGSDAIMVLVSLFGLVAVMLFVFGWVAVAWHRFILLEEYSGLLPAKSGRPIWPYVGRSVGYGMLLLLLAIPLVLLFGAVALNMGDHVAIIIMVIPSAILTFVWFRIALALPSVAVGKPIAIGQAWSASSRMSGTIFGVALILMAIETATGLFIEPITASVPMVGLVLDLCTQWVLLMLGVSILTTLYGHLIEKRPLIDRVFSKAITSPCFAPLA